MADRLTAAAALCDAWFEIDPQVAPFVFRAIFRDLVHEGWDDQQGISATEYEPFGREIVPRMNAVLDAILAGRADQLDTLTGDLLTALRDLRLSPPHIVKNPPTP